MDKTSCNCQYCIADRAARSFDYRTGILTRGASAEESAYILRLIRPFVAKGWQEMREAQGCFTRTVLISPNGQTVMKISGDYFTRSWIGMEIRNVDSFKAFALWAARQNSPHLPTMYHVGALRKFGLFVTVMERLTHINFEEFDNYCCGFVPATTPDFKLDITTLLVASSEYRSRKCDVSRHLDSIIAESLGKITRKMVSVFGFPNDLHAGNIMLRGTTPVLLDPYAHFV